MAVQQIRGSTQIMSGTITNAEINASAAVALTKLAATTASRALESDASGFVSASTVTSTELGYVSGVTSSIQTQLGSKQSTTLTDGNMLVGNVSNVATAVAMSGDITITNAGVSSISTGVIVDADVNASAAIATSKLADGASFVKSDGTVAMAAALTMGSNKITGLADGTLSTDAATYGQLQSSLAGLSWKNTAKLATNAALPASTYANGTLGVGATITADAVGVLTIDGVATVLNDRVLIKDETIENGIYDVTTEGTAGVAFVLTRATDADVSAELDSAAIFIQQGTANADLGFTQTADAPTIGTTTLSWVQFNGAANIVAGAGMTKTGNTLDVIAGTGITVNANSVQVDGTVLTDTRFVTREVPTGLINGVNTSFALASTPQLGSESVYLNGVIQDVGGSNDYTISTNTITYNTAPETGSKLLVSYIVD